MKLVLERTIPSSSSSPCLGKLYVDGVHFCETLEPPFFETPVKPRAIPEGEYPVVLLYSHKFDALLPLLLDVPGFAGIRIHAGNTVDDTSGCILVGSLCDRGEYLLDSRATLRDLMSGLLGCNEKVTIKINNHYELEKTC